MDKQGEKTLEIVLLSMYIAITRYILIFEFSVSVKRNRGGKVCYLCAKVERIAFKSRVPMPRNGNAYTRFARIRHATLVDVHRIWEYLIYLGNMEKNPSILKIQRNE